MVALILLVLWILSVDFPPLIAYILAIVIYREREYYADASGAEPARDTCSLAAALENIESAAEPTRSIKKGPHMRVYRRPARAKNELEGGKACGPLRHTHPIEKRILLLKGDGAPIPGGYT
ncbi:MAG: hypothetical protein V3U68_05095 [Bacteroidota bacterium]